QVDAIVRDIGKFVFDNAEPLARMAVEETEMGSYDDKVLKNKGKARVIWNNLKDKKSRGVIGEDTDTNLVFVAKPMGVVAAVTPDKSNCDTDVQWNVCAKNWKCGNFCVSS
ncbi:MAG: hypothetical protein ACJ0HU_04170, partial [Gammaproteobacteria bacterium]